MKKHIVFGLSLVFDVFWDFLSFSVFEVFELATIIKIWFRDISQMFSLFHFLLQAIDMHNNANSLDKALFLFFICSSDNDFVNGSKHN